MENPADTIVHSPAWWSTHLGEIVGRDVYEYLPETFGVAPDDMRRFYTHELNLEDADGPWPEFHLTAANHTLSVIYFGTPRHEVEFRHAAACGISTTWARTGERSMLPGFRWEEAERFSRLTQSPEITLLLLLSAVDIPCPKHLEARGRILECLDALGYQGSMIERFVEDMIKGLTYNAQWYHDTDFGWLNRSDSCWRCRDRKTKGLRVPADSSFRELKELTDLLDSRG